VSEALAEFECGGEALAGQFGLAEKHVSDAAEVETVGASPGVLKVRVLGAVERVAGVLEGFARVAGREVSFGEGEADVDGVFSEAASVGEEDAGVGFGDGLGVIAEVAIEFGGGVEAAELELDVSGAIGEGAGVLKMKLWRVSTP
jgi:hypothetical protein